MNTLFCKKRSTDKYQKKMKYLIERHEQAKDWNSERSGGNIKKSVHHDEIDQVLGCRDIVTLSNVKEAGSASAELRAEAESEGGDGVAVNTAGDKTKEARTARKKQRK